jgi:[ribosomal protein S18]-alanine N-acetyltransferase
MPYALRAPTESEARAIAGWRYPAPYDLYSGDPAAWQRYLRPAYRYHVVLDDGELIGQCCFGEDARVPGGAYSTEALDVGAGMRPDRVGRGQGGAFLAAVLAFAGERYGARRFAATVAAFNERALAVCRRAGFVEVSRFVSLGAARRDFVLLVR